MTGSACCWECPKCGTRVPKDQTPATTHRSDDEVDRLVASYCVGCVHYTTDDACTLDKGCTKATQAAWRYRAGDVDYTCPRGRWDEHVDILYGINSHNQEWVESKAHVPVAMLNDNGISAVVFHVYGQARETIAAAIERNTPRVVVNCAMFIQAGRVENLARQFADVQWVTSCHSSQSDLARNPSWLKHQFRFLDLARRRDNCHYALVDERTGFYDAFCCPRLIHLNNCVPLPDVEPHRGPHDPPVVSLICEFRSLKNLPNQLTALALARKRARFRLLLAIKNDQEALVTAYARNVGLDPDVRTWQSWRDYRAMVAEEIDVGMQVSFTESFNFVALDHLLAGKPVVGSPAIRYLPGKWQANPDDPEDIAKRLVRMLTRYKEHSDLASRVARRKAHTSNVAFLGTMRALLSGGDHASSD